MTINFFNEGIEFQIDNIITIRKWINKVVLKHGYIPGTLNYIFCDDEYLHNINLSYLKHDTLTDIITFDYSNNKILSGDIFISIERVRENAKELNVSFDEELNRVIIHGVLHMCGFKDHTTEEKNAMRKKEEEALLLIAK